MSQPTALLVKMMRRWMRRSERLSLKSEALMQSYGMSRLIELLSLPYSKSLV